jgi:hypothetical protein
MGTQGKPRKRRTTHTTTNNNEAMETSEIPKQKNNQ